jgi:Ser/Thr protein kinase RdoA (MazF antagonist)
VLRWRRLAGASTSAVHRLDLAGGRALVLRRYLWPGFLEEEPIAPQREVDALRFASRNGLTVPRVLAADITGEAVGDGVPSILMTFLPGRATGVPGLRALADVAAAIHDVDPAGFDHEYYPWYRDTTTGPPPSATRPELWDAAIAAWRDRMPAYQPRFVHRDFHPGNVLWSRGRSTGVVDWANACRGPWGCDVAHCRAQLTVLAGPETADRFLAAYESLTGRTLDPYWEIASVLEYGPSAYDVETVVRSERRLERALR